ncbi:MAG: hypothetical protein MUF37_07890 [Methanoregulaceae archaeon]|nr:hypothetical protein [Methanoregulaceae archaeon]
MKRKSMIGLVILGLCLAGMLVMPVAAAPGAIHQAKTDKVNPAIPQDVKDDLWNVHMKYRIQQFDLNVQKATDVIGVLDKYQYDTTAMKATLSEIMAKKPALQSAVSAKDKDALKSVNQELVNLWKEYGKTVKTVLKADIPVS